MSLYYILRHLTTTTATPDICGSMFVTQTPFIDSDSLRNTMVFTTEDRYEFVGGAFLYYNHAAQAMDAIGQSDADSRGKSVRYIMATFDSAQRFRLVNWTRHDYEPKMSEPETPAYDPFDGVPADTQ